MPLNAIVSGQAFLSNPALIRAALTELQGGQVEIITGAAAGTSMPVPLIRLEDTVVQAIVFPNVYAAPTSDKANITIQTVKASGTVTISGDPLAGETVTVNASVYTWRLVPTKVNEIKITTGQSNTMATALANAINAYEGRYESQLKGDGNRLATCVATAVANVVTVTAQVEGLGNAPQVNGTATVLVATNSGTGVVTLTPATVVATNTFSVAGITFTAVASGATDTQFNLRASNALQGVEIARAINAYQFKYGTLDAVAVANTVTGLVTITPLTAPTGNAIVLSELSTNVVASGTGFLSGGSNIGSIRSTTNLTATTLILFWTNKK